MAIPRSEYLSSVWRDGIFDKKVVFCTGGAGTICSAQVRAMVHLGANACIIGRNVEKTESMAKNIETARKGSRVLGIGGVDVRRIQDMDAAVARCVKELGGIDFVIAGAAGNFISPISTLSSNAFRSVLEIDTIGSFNTLKATLPHLITSAKSNPYSGSSSTSQTSSPTDTSTGTGGRIIFISASFHYTGVPLQSHVSAAKAGVDSLSASAALEYGPRGLTSNVITPGPIAGTEGMARLGDRASEASGAAYRKVPLQRYGTVRDVADGTVYLFSEAGSFVNGAVLVIDGGDWRSPGAPGSSMGKGYPDYLLDGTFEERRERRSSETAKL